MGACEIDVDVSKPYRLIQQVSDLGWVDLYLRSSFGRLVGRFCSYLL